MTSEQIAQVCHEAERALAATQGNTDIVAWNSLPADHKRLAMAGVQGIINGARTEPRCEHTAYQRNLSLNNTTRMSCCEPYYMLPDFVKTKDRMYNMLALLLAS